MMFAGYVKIVLRSIRRHPVFTSVSVASLASGFAAFIVIAVFMQYERSYDRMREATDHTFRLVREFADGVVVILLLAAATVGWLALRAARTDPTRSLRYE